MLKPFRIGLRLVCLGVAALFACQISVKSAGRGRLSGSVESIPVREVGLVLGTGEVLPNGRVNRYFRYRIEAAAKLYHAGKIKRFILSGDHASESYNEPADMRRALIAAGVPESAITLDGKGFRTLDSMVRARDVFGVEQFTVISQRFHVQRALYMAKHLGIDAIGFAAEDVPFSFYVRARELFACVRAVIDAQRLPQQEAKAPPPEAHQPEKIDVTL